MRPAGAFPTLARFEQVRRIGAGGMGVVFEAYDTALDVHVALKTLQLPQEGGFLRRFKDEFRNLQGLKHPNLVRLHELFEHEGQWFFTMESIDGVDFLEYVRPASDAWLRPRRPPVGTPTVPGKLQTLDAAAALVRPAPTAEDPARGLDYGRLREALRQLAMGLVELHGSDRLHLDIKPGNILVGQDGRVVLLDFGLSRSFGPVPESELAGTPIYMAPEQVVADATLGPPADWYAVGMVLYEALTGTVPFTGNTQHVLLAKQKERPVPPRLLARSVPADLDSLCEALLRPEPEARPTGAHMLRVLGARRRSTVEPTSELRFVGRQDELRWLHSGLAASQHGECAVRCIEGESGIGKTALLRTFASQISKVALVLRGRCHECESVPYKAIDGIIDGLSDYLGGLDNATVAALAPADSSLLLEAFPVLRHVEALARCPRIDVRALHAQQVRTRMFGALRRLLTRLAMRTTLVLIIDDLHWADEDSLTLLSELLRPPEPPAILLVATALSLPSSSAVLARRRQLDVIPEASWRELGGLPPADAETLARGLVASSGARVDPRDIAAETKGHPLFIDLLVRQLPPSTTTDEPLRLNEALQRTIDQLHPAGRTLLEVLVVAGRPLIRSIAARATQAEPPIFVAQVESLQAANLIRVEVHHDSKLLELYHDRVRQVVSARASDERPQLHERIALAMEAEGGAQPEALAHHWANAGKLARASEYAAAAAEQAATALAFDRAVRLYIRAIEHLGPDVDASELWSRLGDAWANAGRGADAAHAYETAAAKSPPAAAQVLRQRAADQLLRSGYIDQGIAAMAPSLAARKLDMPATQRGALVSYLTGRALLRLRRPGFGFTPREQAEVDEDTLARLDLCWSATVGLFVVDQLRGLDYHTRHLRLALAAGERFRVARGLCFEALSLAAIGRPQARIDAVLATARQLLDHSETPYGNGLYQLAVATVAYLQGRWADALTASRKGHEIFETQCTGAAWEIASMNTLTRWSQCFLGDLGSVAYEVRSSVEAARKRGDIYATVAICSGFPNVAWLLRGDADGALAVTTEAIQHWSQQGFHLQHLFDLYARVQVYLYRGQAEHASEHLRASWRLLEKSGLLQVELNRVLAVDLRARTELALATAGKDASAARRALTEARRLRREPRAWAQALGMFVEAQVALLTGTRDETTVAAFAEAAAAFEAGGMRLHAAAAEAFVAALASGRQAIVAEENVARFFARQGVSDPTRFVGMLAPAYATVVSVPVPRLRERSSPAAQLTAPPAA